MITQRKSPNFTQGPTPKVGYILHGTLGSYEGAVEWLCTPPDKRNPVSYSSAHYVVAKDGRCTQLVQDSDVSWHAGKISNPTEYAQSVLPKTIFGYFKNPNDSFIGIELEWFEGDTVTDEQINTVVEIINKVNIINPVILTHREVTDYKADFNIKGITDTSMVDKIKRRLVPTVDKESIKKQIKELVNKL